MSLIGNIAPVVGGVLFCAMAYASVRAERRKAREGVDAPGLNAEPAE
ncbi:MAG: hypothetical protein ABIW83_08150 [Allosphingosinicella sp.]